MKAVHTILILSLFILAACSETPTSATVETTSGFDVIDTENVEFEEEDTIVPIDTITDIPEVQQTSSGDTVVTVTEGDLVDLNPLAIDPDGDEVSYSFSPPVDHAFGTWQTEDGDEGTYIVTVTATDGDLSTEEDVKIIVLPSNKPPVITCPTTVKAKEGDSLVLDCEFTDREGDNIAVSYSGYMTSKKKLIGYEDSGSHRVLVSASDGNRVSDKVVIILVDEVNREPIIESIPDIEAMETDTIIVTPKVNDPDGDPVRIQFSALFDSHGKWVTEDGDSGEYFVMVTATDGELEARESFDVHIIDVNTPPVLERITSILVNEGDTIELDINAYDREGDELVVTVGGWFNTKSYTTTYDDAGEHQVIVTVTDGEYETSQIVDITVRNKNRAPVFRHPA